MAKFSIEKFENFNKFEKKIQKCLDFKKLIQLKEYLIEDTNWLCQCNYQNPKGFGCLIHKFLEAFLRQLELNLQENELIEALIDCLKFIQKNSKKLIIIVIVNIELLSSVFYNIMVKNHIYNKKSRSLSNIFDGFFAKIGSGF